MKIKLARAIEGFIPSSIQTPLSNNNDFESLLDELFNIEEVDLLGFDGINGTIESLFDPTNSLFTAKINNVGFLYQIQSATPIIQKNKMLYDVKCLLIEKLADIGAIASTSCSANVIKGLPLQRIGSTYSGNATRLNKSEIKSNFKPTQLDFYELGGDFCTLKIKCLTNPTTDSTLVSHNADGSFTFLFPIYNNGQTLSAGIPQLSTKIKVGNTTLSLHDIISKYSNNIKSIEVLPFLYNWRPTTSFTYDNEGYSATYDAQNDIVNITIISDTYFKLTDAGIFISAEPINAPHFLYKLYDGKAKITISNENILINGSRGFVNTPTGQIPIDFDINSTSSGVRTNDLCVSILDDGFFIEGVFTAKIPATYINFYTDSSGNIFINQQINQKYALMQFNQNKQYSQEQRFIAEKQSLFNTFTNAIGDIGGGGFDSAKTILSGVTNTITQSYFANKQRELDYQKAVADFKLKQQEESELSKYIGKNIAGNATTSDLGNLVAMFAIIIEKNFFEDINGNAICQPDYDYGNSSLTFGNILGISLGGILSSILGLETLPSGFTGFSFVQNHNNMNVNFIFRIINNSTKMQSKIISIPIRFS